MPPGQAADDPRRYAGNRAQAPRAGIEQVETRRTRLVGHERHGPSITGQLELLDIPVDCARQRCDSPARKVDVGEPLELRAPVGGDVHARPSWLNRAGP